MQKVLDKIIDRFKPRACPYCGERCISFWNRLYAGGRLYREVKCPECGVGVRLKRRFTAAKFLIFLILLGIYLYLIYSSYIMAHKGWHIVISIMFYAVIIIGEILFDLFTPLDYEETWKYPKSEKSENNENDSDQSK